MLILALESSAKPASVAVYEHSDDGGKLLGQYFQNNGFSHSRTLLKMAQSLLESLELKPADIDLFAVANGPGSFTGVRIGVSAAKGLAFGIDTPVCGVSTLEAMARQVGSSSSDMLICPVMDARRGQVYNALFRQSGGELERLREDRAISVEELASDLKSLGKTFMPVGDGADLVISKLGNDSGLQLALPCPLAKYQTACGVALAALQAEPAAASTLEPVYLRPSQAERERQKKRKI